MQNIASVRLAGFLNAVAIRAWNRAVQKLAAAAISSFTVRGGEGRQSSDPIQVNIGEYLFKCMISLNILVANQMATIGGHYFTGTNEIRRRRTGEGFFSCDQGVNQIAADFRESRVLKMATTFHNREAERRPAGASSKKAPKHTNSINMGEGNMLTLPKERFWTPSELANACEISVQTVRNWIKAGKLKVIRIGQRQRIYESAWRDFLNSCNE